MNVYCKYVKAVEKGWEWGYYDDDRVIHKKGVAKTQEEAMIKAGMLTCSGDS